MPGTIEFIFITPHKGAPMQRVQQIDALAGLGLEGDRYALKAGTFTKAVEEADAGREVTLIESEAIDAVMREFEIDLSRGRHRRNVVTRNIQLMDLLNHRFLIGSVLLRGDRTCPPCGHLARLVDPRVQEALKNRGGLRATILEGGSISVGDSIKLL